VAYTKRFGLGLLSPAHPLALVVLALVVGAGVLGAHLRRIDGVTDWWVHVALAVQLALVPLLYGVAHNAERPVGKALALLFLLAVAVALWKLYGDLALPREVPADDGFRLRPEAPLYYLPPAMLWGACALLAGHWAAAVGRGMLRARTRRRELTLDEQPGPFD